MSDPIITPGKFLTRDELPVEAMGCSFAVIGFCRFNDMTSKLFAEPLSEKVFSHLDISHQFVGRIGDHKILAADCLYGGPMSATVLEELAYFQIKTVIGYGYAGSLTQDIPVGEIFLARDAIVSDGTSCEYVTDNSMVYPDATLIPILSESLKQRGINVRMGTVWTTDAIYREYPEKIKKWRENGADVVNMDTSYFYAISRVTGLSCIYACVISDCVADPVWDDGFARTKEAMNKLQDSIIDMALNLSY